MGKCSVSDCNYEIKAHGFCETHYKAYRRTGDPLGKFRRGKSGAFSKHPLYRIWNGMWRRCTDAKNDSYKRYGGRGIAVCERWSDFWNFVSDMGVRPSADHSLDRINNDGNYEPQNCRWATPAQQVRNRSTSHLTDELAAMIVSLSKTGITKREISRQTGVDYMAVLNLLKRKTYQEDTINHAAVSPLLFCEVSECLDAHHKDGLCHRHWRRKFEGKSGAGVANLLGLRHCVGCDEEIPHDARLDQIWCSISCRSKHALRKTQEEQLASRGKCGISDCQKPVHAHGLCDSHSGMLRRVPIDLKKESRQRKIAAVEANLPQARDCEHCGTSFTPSKNRDARFCSSKCYFKAYGIAHKEETDALKCVICSAEFIPPSIRSVTCSKKCYQAHFRATHREEIHANQKQYQHSPKGKATRAEWVEETAEEQAARKHDYYMENRDEMIAKSTANNRIYRAAKKLAKVNTG